MWNPHSGKTAASNRKWMIMTVFVCCVKRIYWSSLTEDRETLGPRRHDIVFDSAKCWAHQQTTNEEPITPEGRMHRMAGGLFFKGEAHLQQSCGLAPPPLQTFTSDGHVRTSVCSALKIFCWISIIQLSLGVDFQSSQMKNWIKWLLSESENKPIGLTDVTSPLCCLNWRVDPRDVVEVVFLSLD